jgi:hypothetical protein
MFDIKVFNDRFRKTIQMDANVENHYAGHMDLSRDNKIALHRLFSPYRVPLGLTDEEIRLCIKLDKLRDELRDHDSGYFLIPFPTTEMMVDFDQDIPKKEAFKDALYTFMLAWANK